MPKSVKPKRIGGSKQQTHKGKQPTESREQQPIGSTEQQSAERQSENLERQECVERHSECTKQQGDDIGQQNESREHPIASTEQDVLFSGQLEEWTKLTEEGTSAFENERHVVSETCFKDALALAEKICERQDLSAELNERAQSCLCKSLNNLAALYHVQGKYGLAEELYDRCLDLKLKLYGEEHLEVAVNMHNLAALFSAKRMYLKAEILYKRALDIRQKLLGECHPDLIPVLRNYGLLLKKTNRKEEAASLEERVNKIKS